MSPGTSPVELFPPPSDEPPTPTSFVIIRTTDPDTSLLVDGWVWSVTTSIVLSCLPVTGTRVFYTHVTITRPLSRPRVPLSTYLCITTSTPSPAVTARRVTGTNTPNTV